MNKIDAHIHMHSMSIERGKAFLDNLASKGVSGVAIQAISMYWGFADFENIYWTQAGCTVSCHCGPGTLGVLFITK